MKSTCGALLLTLAVGCGPVEEEARQPPPDVGTSIQGLEDDNGLTINGLTMNGLAFNGLAFNGLAFNGLATSAFTSWFQQSPLTTSLFMKYLVRCAVPAGQSRTFSEGGFTYTWPGGLGLAPTWSGGAPATVEEQQVVTACMGALVNKFGRSVGVSVLGANAQGQLIPYSAYELSAYSQREACFFGNMFTDEGLYVGNDQAPLAPWQSSLRACALEGSNACPPLVHIGGCAERCTLDSTGRTTRGAPSTAGATVPSPPGCVPRTSSCAVTAAASPPSPVAAATATTTARWTAAPAAEPGGSHRPGPGAPQRPPWLRVRSR